ncbi:hypothetical protein MMPV_005181 [Pyropia vietnamensis]
MEQVGTNIAVWPPPAEGPRQCRPSPLAVAALPEGGAESPANRTLSSISVITPAGSVTSSSQTDSASSSFDEAAAVAVVIPNGCTIPRSSSGASSSASSARASSSRAPSSRGSLSSRVSSPSSPRAYAASSRASSPRPAAPDRLSHPQAPSESEAAAAPTMLPYGPPLSAASGRCTSEMGPSTTSSSSLRALPRPKVFIARTAAVASRVSRGTDGANAGHDGTSRRISVEDSGRGGTTSRRPRTRKPRANPRPPPRDQALAVRCASTPRPSESTSATKANGGAHNRRLLGPGDDFGALLAGRVSLLEPVVVTPDLDRAVTVLPGDDDASFSGLPLSASADGAVPSAGAARAERPPAPGVRGGMAGAAAAATAAAAGRPTALVPVDRPFGGGAGVVPKRVAARWLTRRKSTVGGGNEWMRSAEEAAAAAAAAALVVGGGGGGGDDGGRTVLDGDRQRPAFANGSSPRKGHPVLRAVAGIFGWRRRHHP